MGCECCWDVNAHKGQKPCERRERVDERGGGGEKKKQEKTYTVE